MNSLFQDGATISWLLGESLILNHSRRSVVAGTPCATRCSSARERDDGSRLFHAARISTTR
jgi:hypothetical protein